MYRYNIELNSACTLKIDLTELNLMAATRVSLVLMHPPICIKENKLALKSIRIELLLLVNKIIYLSDLVQCYLGQQ